MPREKCCHVTYMALAEPTDSSQEGASLVWTLSARINVLRRFYLFCSRYLDKEKQSKQSARHLTYTNT